MRILATVVLVAFTVIIAVGYALTADDTVQKSELVARGEHLVRLGSCDDCHTPKIMTPQGPALDMNHRLAGHPQSDIISAVDTVGLSGRWIAKTNGNMTAWVGPWGVSFAANLTPDKKTGLGSWTEEAFIKALRTGKHRGFGRPILPPMPWENYTTLPDDDLKAIFAYIMSLPPIENTVPEPLPPAAQ